MKNFSNKIVWITGASSGIGEALVYAFAKENARIIVSARREEELNRVKNNCGEKKNNIFVFLLDVEDNQQITLVAEKVIKQFGAIDILVNNSGISQRSLVKETPLEIDRKVMEVNFFGAVALTKAVLPAMIKNGGGQIVVTSSVVGKFGIPLRSAYSASKHALQGFFETLRAESVNDKINVLMLLPGRVVTNISINAITKEGKKYGIMDPGQAQGISAEVVANKVLKALRSNKKELLIGGKEVIMVYIRRFLPWLFYKIAPKVKPV